MRHRKGGCPIERTIHSILLLSLAFLLIAAGEPKAASGWIRSPGFEGGYIMQLLVHPADPQRMYCLDGSGLIYRSMDAGAHWTAVFSENGWYWDRLAIDPTNPDVIYGISSYGAVRKSTDGGSTFRLWPTWQQIQFGFYEVLVHPTNPNTLYAAVDEWTGVAMSTNGGFSWGPIGWGLPFTEKTALVMDPANPSILYTCDDYAIYKTIDGGGDWSPVYSPIYGAGFRQLAIDPNHTEIVYAGSFLGITRTTDGGVTWVEVNTGLPPNTYMPVLFVDPVVPGTVYAGVISHGVYKSIDWGAHWAAAQAGMDHTRVTNFAACGGANPAVYAATAGGGIFMSYDRAHQWNSTNSGIYGQIITSIAQDPNNPTMLYIGTYGGGVYRSANRGDSWASARNGLQEEVIWAIAIHPNDSTTLYAGIYEGGVCKTTNSGLSWVRSSQNDGTYQFDYRVTSLAIDPVTPNVVIAGSYYGVVFSTTDGGGHWAPADPGLSAGRIRWLGFDPFASHAVYAGFNGFARSSDGGNRWKGLSDRHTRTVAFDPQIRGVIYQGTERDGIWKTLNYGQDWSYLGFDNRDQAINAIAVDPRNSSIVYAGFRGSGVHRSSDGGTSWSEMTEGLTTLPTSRNIYFLRVDPISSAILYAGTGAGFYKCLLPPQLTAAYPGDITKGMQVTIRGSGFLVGGKVTVLFNGIAAITVEIVDDGTIRAVVPALPPGPVTITVTTVAGTATLAGDRNGPAIVSVPALTDGGFLLLAGALLTAGLFLLKR